MWQSSDTGHMPWGTEERSALKSHVWSKCPWKDQTYVWISQIREGVMDREEEMGGMDGWEMKGEKMKGVDKPQKQRTC